MGFIAWGLMMVYVYRANNAFMQTDANLSTLGLKDHPVVIMLAPTIAGEHCHRC
jgi:hypothetical protein